MHNLGIIIIIIIIIIIYFIFFKTNLHFYAEIFVCVWVFRL